MYKINVVFFTVIQFLSLFDSTKQSHVRQTINTFKAIGKTIKGPMLGTIGNSIKKSIVKTFGNTIKNSVSIFHQNRNIVKNLACGLQKKYLKSSNNFGNKSVKYLREEGIKKFKYITHYATEGSKQLVIRKGRRDIQMRSAEQMHGTQLRSLFNMISKSKPQLPLLFVAGGLDKLTQFNLLPSDDNIDLKDPKEQKKIKNREKYLKNKEYISEIMKAYYQKNKDKLLEKNRIYHETHKEKLTKYRQEYYIKNKAKIIKQHQQYNNKNQVKISKYNSEKYLRNKLINKLKDGPKSDSENTIKKKRGRPKLKNKVGSEKK